MSSAYRYNVSKSQLRWFSHYPSLTMVRSDGIFITADATSISRYSIVLYLNTTRDGSGATRFFEVESMKYVDVTPVQGRAVIFDQRLPHAGLATKDTKYSARTDLLVDQPDVDFRLG